MSICAPWPASTRRPMARKQLSGPRPVVAYAGGEVVIEVHLVAAGVLQGRRATGPATASEKNGSENRPDRPTAVGPVFAPATRGGPAAPLHAERRSGAGCCAPNPTTACGRRRCCSTCAMRSAPATSGWHGRAATATSGRRCCRLPLLLMPTAACRSPASPQDWLAERKGALDEGLRRLDAAARAGAIAGASIDEGHAPHRKDRSRRAGRGRRPRRRPLSADTRHADHGHSARGGRRHQVHRGLHAPARTGAPCRDRIGLLNVLPRIDNPPA